MHTVDGGASWTPQVSGTTSTLLDVDFVDPLDGWAVGRGGVILHTVNGGTNWLPQVSGTTVSLSGVAFSNALIGTVVGNGGVTFYTQDGGTTWHGPGFPNATTRNDLFGVDAPPGSFQAHRSGAAGTPLVSPDGGITFRTRSPLPPTRCSTFPFLMRPTAWSSGTTASQPAPRTAGSPTFRPSRQPRLATICSASTSAAAAPLWWRWRRHRPQR